MYFRAGLQQTLFHLFLAGDAVFRPRYRFQPLRLHFFLAAHTLAVVLITNSLEGFVHVSQGLLERVPVVDGVVRDGRHFIVIDGVYRLLGELICDDAAGFGIVYDPQRRIFGDMTFGVSSCLVKKQEN